MGQIWKIFLWPKISETASSSGLWIFQHLTLKVNPLESSRVPPTKSVISALMANELTAYRTTASIPLLFTNREHLPRQIISFLHLTRNTHCCTEAVHKDNSMQHTWGEDWQDFMKHPPPSSSPNPRDTSLSGRALQTNAASNHSLLLMCLKSTGSNTCGYQQHWEFSCHYKTSCGRCEKA